MTTAFITIPNKYLYLNTLLNQSPSKLHKTNRILSHLKLLLRKTNRWDNISLTYRKIEVEEMHSYLLPREKDITRECAPPSHRLQFLICRAEMWCVHLSEREWRQRKWEKIEITLAKKKKNEFGHKIFRLKARDHIFANDRESCLWFLYIKKRFSHQQ